MQLTSFGTEAWTFACQTKLSVSHKWSATKVILSRRAHMDT